jgi:hypothetical protein
VDVGALRDLAAGDTSEIRTVAGCHLAAGETCGCTIGGWRDIRLQGGRREMHTVAEWAA